MATLLETNAPTNAATGATGRKLAELALPCGCRLQIRESLEGGVLAGVLLVRVHCQNGSVVVMGPPMSFDAAAVEMAHRQAHALLEAAESAEDGEIEVLP